MKRIYEEITSWLALQVQASHANGFVIGVSGGIDSAVVSTLCAETKLYTLALSMPIRQKEEQCDLAKEHLTWLSRKYPTVETKILPLDSIFDNIEREARSHNINGDLALANARSRLRMLTLYLFANEKHLLVAGTGNRIEDYGVGFFTKYGDGGVDISPIGDLMKSEVYQLGEYLGVSKNILEAAPTDGLWDDGRTDEQQLGCTYSDLEWAMQFHEVCGKYPEHIRYLSDEQKETYEKFLKLHLANSHKMKMPPICKARR